MTAATFSNLSRKQVQKLADWTVFSLGVLSLTVAIGATIMTSSDAVAANQAENSAIEIKAG